MRQSHVVAPHHLGDAVRPFRRARVGLVRASPLNEDEQKRRKIMELQKEISEDLVMASEKERVARKEKVGLRHPPF
jgi:hypothetical protein